MDNDVFLKIIKGEIPAEKIYEDEHTFAFLDINPVNPGHTLVVPKERYKNLYEMPEDVLCAVIKTVQKMSVAIKAAMNADGINLEMNNDSAAGQLVFHAHIHIVPRFSNDGFKHWPGTPYEDGEEGDVGEKIRNQLQ